MQILINISKEAKGLLDGKIKALNVDLYSELIQAVQNGVVLPEKYNNPVEQIKELKEINRQLICSISKCRKMIADICGENKENKDEYRD